MEMRSAALPAGVWRVTESESESEDGAAIAAAELVTERLKRRLEERARRVRPRVALLSMHRRR